MTANEMRPVDFGTPDEVIAGLDRINAHNAAVAETGALTREAIAIVKLNAIVKHLNMILGRDAITLLEAVADVEKAAEWARLHIERRGQENDELRISLEHYVAAALAAQAPEPSTSAVGYECGCSVEQAQQLEEGKFFYPYCPRHKKPLKRAAATASTGAQVKCPKCESTMVSVIYECDMCQTEFEYVPASLSAGGLTDDVREIYDPDEFDYMCANGHRKIQLRQQDGLGCPLCALATTEQPAPTKEKQS